MVSSDKVAVVGDWLIRSDRDSVYAIVSDFEHMPEHFPKVARAIRILDRDGDVLTIEADAASFGRLFPPVKVSMTAELLLLDDPDGTRIKYTYFVTVKHRRLRPLYAWAVRTFGLPYWKRCFVDRLEILLNVDGPDIASTTAG
ncbi:MAG: SRPBCC family protein [Actinomycetota bacterium]|nr:SRPBCC family protein [Actinomycetota bacterium]